MMEFPHWKMVTILYRWSGLGNLVVQDTHWVWATSYQELRHHRSLSKEPPKFLRHGIPKSWNHQLVDPHLALQVIRFCTVSYYFCVSTVLVEHGIYNKSFKDSKTLSILTSLSLSGISSLHPYLATDWITSWWGRWGWGKGEFPNSQTRSFF